MFHLVKMREINADDAVFCCISAAAGVLLLKPPNTFAAGYNSLNFGYVILTLCLVAAVDEWQKQRVFTLGKKSWDYVKQSTKVNLSFFGIQSGSVAWLTSDENTPL